MTLSIRLHLDLVEDRLELLDPVDSPCQSVILPNDPYLIPRDRPEHVLGEWRGHVGVPGQVVESLVRHLDAVQG